MKFTSEDLMKAMGLQVGDYIRIGTKELEKYTFSVDDEDGLMLVYEGYEYPIGYLLDHDFEILPRPKRVGDLKCGELECMSCPLRILSHCSKSRGREDALYKILNYWNNEYPIFDQEIYDLLKARLDKVVEE